MAALRRVGRGGLNEEAAEGIEEGGEEQGAENGRRTEVVSNSEIVRHPSQAEQALRVLAAQLRGLRGLDGEAGAHPRMKAFRLVRHYQNTSSHQPSGVYGYLCTY